MIATFESNFHIRLDKVTKEELERIEELATASAFNWHKKETYEICYLFKYTYLPAGLWMRIFKKLQAEGYNVSLNGIKNFIDSITEDEFNDWVDYYSNLNTEKYKSLYWWQAEGAFNAIKYRISRNEFDTGAGKTLIIWLITKFLLQKRFFNNEKVLIVVNRKNLVDQIVNKDFPDFSKDGFLKCDTVFSGGIKLAQSNVVVGTYQSLSSYNTEYFSQFGALILDECHGGLAKSIKDDIVGKLNPNMMKYIHGLSATMFDDESLEGLTLESYLGPIIMKVPLSVLQDEGAVTPVKISIMKLIYPTTMTYDLWHDEDIRDSKKKLHLERQWVHRQFHRLYCVGQTCLNYKGNHVLMCESLNAVKKYSNYLKAHCPKHAINIIHGNISFDERKRIQDLLESSDNNLVIATSETMGTGISIKNIHAVHALDGGRSFIKIRQQIGRGVRLHASKEYLMFFDWCDLILKDKKWFDPEDVLSKIYKNNLATHSSERKKIYDNRQIPWTEYKIHIKNWTVDEFKTELNNVRKFQLSET